jgi:conjugal transfer mating pair stabilization protein TraN
MSCSDDEKVTAMARRARASIRRLLLELHQRLRQVRRLPPNGPNHCCFNSRLARIINEQGRAQVGKGWGSDTARNPIAAASAWPAAKPRLFRMDLSEFYAEITPTSSTGTAAGNAAGRVPACYFGNGQC